MGPGLAKLVYSFESWTSPSPTTAIGKEQMQQGCFNDHGTLKMARSMESIVFPIVVTTVQ